MDDLNAVDLTLTIREKISKGVPLDLCEVFALVACSYYAINFVLHDIFGLPLPENKKDDQ